MPKITPRKNNNEVKIKTKVSNQSAKPFKWWEADTKDQAARELISTALYLKEQQQYRYRQAAVYARLYGNMSLFNFVGSNMNRMNMGSNLPIDRPTMNVIQSCIDTKVSRITQAKPRPLFLTDGADYKERNLAEQMNKFIAGELFRSKAYQLSEHLLRDAEVWGTGVWKILESLDHKVCIERKLYTDVLFDVNDSRDGNPRMIYEFTLVDRDVLIEHFPKFRSDITKAEQAYPDNSDTSAKTVSDQVMLVEAFRLPSSKKAGDGRHMIACSAGPLLDEEFNKERFPYVFLHSSPRMIGMEGQGAAERLMGTQVEINKLLMTISQSINLVGVPRVFVEDGSKVVKAHLNNNVGAIVTYKGTKPSYEVAPCVPQELYAQLERLVQFAYQQEGVSSMNATGKKPEGLDSGSAIRSYDDIQSDRFASLEYRYRQAFIDASYLIIDKAIDIAEEQGSYDTVYPNKDGNKEINLPDIKKLKNNPYILQCMDTSSLPKEPSGRIATITERMQAGIYSQQAGMSLMQSLDLISEDQLMTASEKRIRKLLDDIIENGKYEPPDPFMDLMLAEKIVTEYYNLYMTYKLEESKAEKLRNFHTQIQALKQAAVAPPPAPMAVAPQAVPTAPPVSDMLPTGPQGQQLVS